MAISALGYVCIGTSDPDAWARFACEVMGLQARRAEDGALLLRVDRRDWRLRIEQGSADDITIVGWECASRTDFEETLALLGDAATLDPALARARDVCGLARFTDPAGMACELFWGARDRTDRPFASPLGVSFVTGDQGLGHVVFVAPDPARYEAFYTSLGFRISDYIDMEIAPGFVLPVSFMHCNPRHHSLAFAPAPNPPFVKKCIHVMLQTELLDDVGMAIARAETLGVPISMTLGRHSNDEMLSVYFETPSGFEFEYGWGARVIGPDWQVVRHDVISKWGHKMVGGPTHHG